MSVDKRIFKILVLINCLCVGIAYPQSMRVVLKIDPVKLKIHYSQFDREQLFSVIDSDEIILASKKYLMIIKEDSVIKRVLSPVSIFAFDITSKGNGLIIGTHDDLYQIKNFQITSKLYRLSLGKNILDDIWKIDMINDSIARLAFGNYGAFVYLNIRKGGPDNYRIVKNDITDFITHNAINSYVGATGDIHYFCEWNFDAKSEYLIGRKFSNGKTIIVKSYKLGDLGRDAQETVPIRYDEKSHCFYKLTYKNKMLVLYRGNVSDLAITK